MDRVAVKEDVPIIPSAGMYSVEEIQKYRTCLQQKYTLPFCLSMLASITVGKTYPFQSSVNIVPKRIGVGMLTFIIGNHIAGIYSSLSCAHVLDPARARAQNRQENVKIYEGAPADSQEQKTPEIAPLDSTEYSPLDLSLPVNFGTDSIRTDSLYDDVNRTSEVPEGKHMTYDELRMRNREQYRQRSEEGKPIHMEPIKREDGDADKWDVGIRPIPRRTNKYGDVWE